MKKFLTLLAMLAICAMLVMAVSAEVTVTYDLTQEATDDGASSTYVITATLVNPDAAEFQIWYNHIEFDNTIIVPADYYDGSVVDLENNPDYCIEAASYTNRGTTYKATIVDPYWTANGNITTHEFDSYYAETTKIVNKTGLAVFKFYFNFADGKSADDFTSDSFKIVSARYVDNDIDYYYQREGHEDNMTIINNVVPEATVITIPVLAGDKIYMNGDGTFVTAAEAGDYVVPANAGYVAVNTGYTAQKTYFVDSTSATLVHENGVLIRDGQYNVRASKSSDEAEYGEDRSGLRFFMDHAIAGRTVENHEIVEVGYVMTAESNKVINNNGKGENYILDMNMVDSGFANSGYAFNTDNGTDFAFETGDDTYIITGVFYNIPMNAVQIPIAARAYYRVGDTYIYGEVTKTTLYEEAVKVKESANFDSLAEEAQDYINEIIAQVDGEETPIVEEEVIIDISGLYGGV